MKTNKLFLFFFLLCNSLVYSQKTAPVPKLPKPSSGKPSAISKGVAATNGIVYLNLKKAVVGSSYVDIPVSFTSTDSIVSLDFAMKFTEGLLSYESIVSHVPYLTDVLAKYSPDDKTLRFTSNSQQYYIVDQTIATLRFTRTGTLKNKDLFGFAGYLNGDKVSMETRGHFPFRSGSLKFWSDNSPIPYDVTDPDRYLIVNIYGVDSSCANKTAPVQSDLNGEFTFIEDRSSLQIERDILSTTDVQPVINGFDVNLGRKVLVNDLSFIPNIYQLNALDVNADGVISAGDISQMNQRSVSTLTEFKQKWNYTTNGNSNGNPSKDWLFLDSVSLANPAYQISASFPFSDGIGYCKSDVPLLHVCLQAPLPDAAITSASSTYTGILLGDTNGNYATVANDGKIKRTTVAANK